VGYHASKIVHNIRWLIPEFAKIKESSAKHFNDLKQVRSPAIPEKGGTRLA
jgi:hypothetical protein